MRPIFYLNLIVGVRGHFVLPKDDIGSAAARGSCKLDRLAIRVCLAFTAPNPRSGNPMIVNGRFRGFRNRLELSTRCVVTEVEFP